MQLTTQLTLIVPVSISRPINPPTSQQFALHVSSAKASIASLSLLSAFSDAFALTRYQSSPTFIM